MVASESAPWSCYLHKETKVPQPPKPDEPKFPIHGGATLMIDPGPNAKTYHDGWCCVCGIDMRPRKRVLLVSRQGRIYEEDPKTGKRKRAEVLDGYEKAAVKIQSWWRGVKPNQVAEWDDVFRKEENEEEVVDEGIVVRAPQARFLKIEEVRVVDGKVGPLERLEARMCGDCREDFEVVSL